MRSSPEHLASAVDTLLRRSELSPEETQRRFEQAFDIDRWQRLAPFASIGRERWDEGEPSSISDSAADREKRRLD